MSQARKPEARPMARDFACFVCGSDACFGFAQRATLGLQRWFCPSHKSEGQTYWRSLNDNS